VDIAGLVAGASKGEGLGNKFLSHIRETDAIAHVVRCFVNDDVVHVAGRIDPIADIDVIQHRARARRPRHRRARFAACEKASKAGDKDAIRQRDLLSACARTSMLEIRAHPRDGPGRRPCLGSTA